MTTAPAAVARAGALVTWREAPTAAKALIVGTFIHRLGGFIQVFLVLYLTERGFTANQAGLALGVYGGGMVFGVLVGGWLSDRIGPRRTIVGSMALTSVMLPLVLYVTSYPVVLGVVALIGAVGQAYRPASTSALSRLVPEARHVMTFAMVRLAINLGTSIGPLLGAALVTVSYSLLFWVEALVVLVFAGIAWWAMPVEAVARQESSGRYTEVLRDRRYVIYLLATLITSMMFMQYAAALPLAVVSAGMTVTLFGALLALNGFLVVGCELVIAKQVQHLPPRVLTVTGIVLTAVGFAIYALPWGAAGFVLGTVVWTIGEIIGFPTFFFAYPAKAGPEHLRGRYIGASSSVYGLGSALGPVVGIALWSQLGSGFWLICGVAGLAAAALTWIGVVPDGARSSRAGHSRSDADGS